MHEGCKTRDWSERGGAWRNGLNVKGLLNALYVWSKEGIGLIYKEFKNPKKTKIADESTWVSNFQMKPSECPERISSWGFKEIMNHDS